MKHQNYIHKQFNIGWLRVSLYILGKKFTLRIEISKGWD